MIIYPAIDILDGRCVRLLHGRFDQATVYRDDPVAMACDFAAAGASHLHVVDLAGSRDGTRPAAELIKRIVAASGLRVQVGGGIRHLDTALAYRDAGVEHLVLGSVAARDPEATGAIVKAIGPARVTIGLDLRLGADGGLDQAEVSIDGWTKGAGVTPAALLLRYADLGIRRVLCTDVSRDGALTGPNISLYQAILTDATLGRVAGGLQLLASGGVASLVDLSALRAVGVHGVIIGKALYEGRFTLAEALTC